MPISRRSLVAGLCAAAVLLGISLGLGAAASERPFLTVSGKIAGAEKGSVTFDRAQLEALGTVSFTTSTPWYNEKVTFEGVPLAALMKSVDAKGDRLVATALNDYSAELPMTDVVKYNPILALKRDGQYMPIRDKGPLFIVYPYDSRPELKAQQFYSRSVWQVARIEVK
jgi:hypothetical protein